MPTLNETYELYRQTKEAGQPLVECLERLYAAVKTNVTTILGRTLKRKPDEYLVADIAADVLVEIDKFDPTKAQFATWVDRRTRGDCLNYLKKYYRENGVETVSADDIKDLAASHNPDFDLFLQELLGSLEEDDVTLLMNKLQGYSIAEIGQLLGISEGAVNMRWRRLRDRLKAEFSQN